MGWRELGARRFTSTRRSDRREASGSDPLIVGMDRYAIASELAFYAPDRAKSVGETSSGHLFGQMGLMYERWFPPAAESGRTLLLVAWGRDELAGERLQSSVERLEPIEEGVMMRGETRHSPLLLPLRLRLSRVRGAVTPCDRACVSAPLAVLDVELHLRHAVRDRAQTDEIRSTTRNRRAGRVQSHRAQQLHAEWAYQPRFPGGIVPNHTLNGVPEWAYGVTDWFEAGLYLPLYSISGSGALTYNGFKVRTLFVKPDAANQRFFYGVNFEFSCEHRALGSKPQHAGDPRHHRLASRVIRDDRQSDPRQFLPRDSARLDFAPASRLAYNLNKTWAIAAEEYDDFGPLRGFHPASQQQHQLFAVFDYGGKPWTIEGGAGSASPTPRITWCSSSSCRAI